MGKSVSKALKKVTGGVSKVVKGAVKTVGKATGIVDDSPVQQVSVKEAPVAAVPVTVPQDNPTTVDTETTPADAKRGRRAGKRGLSIARNSGGGISI